MDVIKMMMFDLNWSKHDAPHPCNLPSSPQDWAWVDPQTYFDWQVGVGNNAIFLQAYTYGGYAFYPTRLGPVPPGPGQHLLPKVFELSHQAGLPFCSYFCVGADVATNGYHGEWVIPGSRRTWSHGFLGPESPWTDLLCARMREFLREYPVDWLMFDWFCYGDLKTDFQVQPYWFVKEPFARIIGRPMPEDPAQITPEESLEYKRQVLAEQFGRLRDTVKETSPQTRICFTPPYWGPADPQWVDHPMLAGSDMLLAEFSSEETMAWLLSIRRPGQRVMGTVMNVHGPMSPEEMLKWAQRGCDLSGYLWGTPPVFAPHPAHVAGMEAVKRGFELIG